MPITATALVALQSTSNVSSYATASTTPSAGRLVLCAVASSKASTPDLPTVSGCGLTWVQIATVLFDTAGTPTKRVTLFRALGTPTSGAITASFGGVSQTGCNIFVAEFGPVDDSGTNGSGAVVQSATNAVDAATSITVTLSSFARPENAAYGCAFTDIGTNSTVGSGFTLLARGGYATPNHTGNTEFKNNEDTGVDWTFSTADAGAIAIEIDILVIECTGAGTLGHFSGSTAAEQQLVASAAGSLAPVTGSCTALEQHEGAAAGGLGALLGASAVEQQLVAAGAGTLGKQHGAGAAEVQLLATASADLAGLAGAAAGVEVVEAAGAKQLGALSGAAAGELQQLAAGAGSLAPAAGAAAGELVHVGAGAGTLGALVAAGAEAALVIIDTIQLNGRVRQVVRLDLRVRSQARCDGRVNAQVPLEVALAGQAVVGARVRRQVLVGLDP